MAWYKHPIVGSVEFAALSGGRIRLLNNWEAENISTVFIPELKGVPTYGGKFSGNVRFYTRAIPQLKAAFAEIGRRGLAVDIIFWDGSFVPRMKRGSSTSPSNHTFGTAFDINAEWNGFRRKPSAPGTKGSVWRLVPIFKKYGFECGAEWRNTPDGMHFEIERLMSASEVAQIAGNVAPQAKVPPVAEPRPFVAVLNNEVLTGARIENGVMLAPVREVLDALGFVVDAVNDRISERNRFDIRAVPKE